MRRRILPRTSGRARRYGGVAVSDVCPWVDVRLPLLSLPYIQCVKVLRGFNRCAKIGIIAQFAKFCAIFYALSPSFSLQTAPKTDYRDKILKRRTHIARASPLFCACRPIFFACLLSFSHKLSLIFIQALHRSLRAQSAFRPFALRCKPQTAKLFGKLWKLSPQPAKFFGRATKL